MLVAEDLSNPLMPSLGQQFLSLGTQHRYDLDVDVRFVKVRDECDRLALMGCARRQSDLHNSTFDTVS
jgi:hypothetical protein